VIAGVLEQLSIRLNEIIARAKTKNIEVSFFMSILILKFQRNAFSIENRKTKIR
jgi:hypothetical protein